MHVDAELVFEALGPTFDLGNLSSNDTWSSAHYEQHGTIRGHLVFDGQRTEFSGSGIRDHSWGPRDLNFFNHHAWMSGQFPSGRTFMVFSIVDMAGQSSAYALVDDGLGMREAKLVSTAPHLGNIADVETGYDIVLTTADGCQETIRAEIQQVPFFALGGPSEILFGKQPASIAHHLLFEAQTKFEWNGEVGYGFTDRTFNQKNQPRA